MKYKKRHDRIHIATERKAAALILAGALALLTAGLTACGIVGEQNTNRITVSGQDTPDQQSAAGEAYLDAASGVETGMMDFEEKGSFTGEQAEVLAAEQKALVSAYMEAYYQGLTALRTSDYASLFSDDAKEQVLMNESASAYVTGLRNMQDGDLRLADYRYALDINLVQETESGTEIQMTETSTQNFVQTPDVDTMLYNIRHIFLLEETDAGWKLAEHWQRDNIYRNLLGDYWSWDERALTMEEPDAYFAQQVEKLLAEAEEEKLLRKTINATSDNQSERPQADHPYQREAAVSYSDTWVGQRNDAWSDFTGRGGNCQNFVSQCLLAGGIPMDDRGDAVWSWVSEENYTASWVGVDAFYRYAAENTGFGLLADADADYGEGEAGDLIRMGSDTDWNHIVIISEVVRDQDGEVIDYLINSNTSDVKNFPVSAYPNVKQRLMKLYGWNEQ